MAIAAAMVVGACGGDEPLGDGAPTCGMPRGDGPHLPPEGAVCDRLSEHRLISLDHQGRVVLGEGPLPFAPSSALFSDYAHKTRTVWIPPGESARLTDRGPLDLPVGTMVTKTFAFPQDLREPDRSLRVIETRLLIRRQDGWRAFPYIWDEAQTEAYHAPVGATVPVRWIHTDGTERSTDYVVPNRNQCIECHGRTHPETGRKELQPIGLKAKHLNGELDYGPFFPGEGSQNQLGRWEEAGYLTGVPADLGSVPRLPAWDDPASGTLHERARAYLDINCGHCHGEGGSAAHTGLWMESEVQDPLRWGVCQGREPEDPTVAVLPIVPGRPDASRILARMDTTGRDRMPRLGRTVVHDEGVALIRDWIEWLGTEEAVAALGLDDPRLGCF
ncbi:MAG: SO2930 family diheme c-type cytochrome [Myxococcota bacterium]